LRIKAGNLYGSTTYGGTIDENGVVFQLVRPTTTGGAWTENVLYRFQGGSNDGSFASGGLIFDGAGNLYGETAFGGGCNNGTVFQLSPPASQGGAWTLAKSKPTARLGAVIAIARVLETVKDCLGLPYSGLTFGKNGRLYGATSGNNAVKPRQYGTVFKIVP
jgi:uncharacterized repeat protein (TIGR03803 family)